MALVSCWLPWQITINLAAWNNTRLLAHSSGDQKSKIGVSRLRSGCLQDCVPPGGFRGESHSLLFLASRGCLHSTGQSMPHPYLPTRQEVMVTQPRGELPSKVETRVLSLFPPKTVLANIWRRADHPIYLQQHFHKPEILFSHQTKELRRELNL